MENIRHKVLVIDDDANILDLLKSGLEVMGYNAATCEDVHSFEKLMASFRPDIILMDVNMPGGDGISLCRNLKLSKDTADIPVIMLTAFSDDRTFHDAMLFGANGFITKPFELSDIKKKIEECLGKANLKKENLK